jgi:hypothetical protein
MFTPSSVIEIELWGSPLTVELRTELAVCTPGRNCGNRRPRSHRQAADLFRVDHRGGRGRRGRMISVAAVTTTSQTGRQLQRGPTVAVAGRDGHTLQHGLLEPLQ